MSWSYLGLALQGLLLRTKVCTGPRTPHDILLALPALVLYSGLEEGANRNNVNAVSILVMAGVLDLNN